MSLPEILIIDDEKQILSAMKRTFKDSFIVHTVDSVEDALSTIHSNKIDAILCDHNLNAEITGVDLLSGIHKEFPYITKMMFTGYKDPNIARSALSDGKIFRFISKPWDDEFLRSSFDLSVKRTRLARKNYDLLNQIEEQNKKIETATKIMERDLRLNEKKVQETARSISLLENQVDSVNKLMAKISRSSNFEKMIDSILYSIKDIIDCDHSSVLNIRQETKIVDVYSARGQESFILDNLPELRFLIKNMEQTGYNPIFLDQSYKKISNKILNFDSDLEMGSILLYPSKGVGNDGDTEIFILVLARKSRSGFSKEDVYRLKDLSTCISVSLGWINTAKYLRYSLKKWQEIFNAILDPLFIITKDYEISIYNSAFEKLLADNIGIITTQKCYKVIKGLDHACADCRVLEVFNTSSTLRLDRALCFNDTSIVSTLYPVSKYGEVSSVIIYNNDRRAEFKLYKQLLQSEKLAAIGRLASDIAHEFNNPLGGILAYAQVLKNEKTLKEDAISDLSEIESACKRANAVISNLMQFSRDTSHDLDSIFSVKKAIEDTLPLLNVCIKQHKLKINTDSETDEYLVLGNPGKIQQVVFNLITNSVHASPDGGDIEISLSKEDTSSVIMKFRDTGCGIAKDHIARVFEPFFTTKAKEQGTGLGLYVCHGIIEDHGGLISVISEEGKGTIFTVEIPSWSYRDDLIAY